MALTATAAAKAARDNFDFTDIAFSMLRLAKPNGPLGSFDGTRSKLVRPVRPKMHAAWPTHGSVKGAAQLLAKGGWKSLQAKRQKSLAGR
jgi:hypothetical protein